MKKIILILIAFLSISPAQASDVKLDSETKHQKKLDFDGTYVEGLSKHSLDSLMQMSDADSKRKKVHLYQKRTNFAPETSETLHETRYN